MTTRSLLAVKDSCIISIFLLYARREKDRSGIGGESLYPSPAEQPTELQCAVVCRSLVQIAEVPRRSPRPVRCSDCHIHVFVSIIFLRLLEVGGIVRE
jgi:hypothetical protein